MKVKEQLFFKIIFKNNYQIGFNFHSWQTTFIKYKFFALILFPKVSLTVYFIPR